MSRYYVCEVSPFLRICDKQDGVVEAINKRKFDAIINSGIEVDGVSSDGKYVLSEESNLFHKRYRLPYMKMVLADSDESDFSYEEHQLYNFSLAGTNVVVYDDESDGFNELYEIILTVRFNLDCYGSKDLYLDVSAYTFDNSVSHLVKLNCCDEFLDALEKGVERRDLPYINKVIKSYFSSFKSLCEFINLNNDYGLTIMLQDVNDKFPTFNDLWGTFADICDNWY